MKRKVVVRRIAVRALSFTMATSLTLQSAPLMALAAENDPNSQGGGLN